MQNLFKHLPSEINCMPFKHIKLREQRNNMTEKYEFEVGEDGLDYDILDKSYNAHTQACLLTNGLKKGMNILDIGSGAGVMTAWLATQVGEEGSVTAVDNSAEQLQQVQTRTETLGLTNVETHVLSAYDLQTLDQQFDAVYCRFLLHHLHSPRLALDSIFEALKPNGIYFGQEGLVDTMFAYPYTEHWVGKPFPGRSPLEDRHVQEGKDRDGDFGLRLMFEAIQTGFKILDCQYHQPMLWTKEQKRGLLAGLIAFKNTELAQGMTEEQWLMRYEAFQQLIDDEQQLIGFYGSCFIAGQKPDCQI